MHGGFVERADNRVGRKCRSPTTDWFSSSTIAGNPTVRQSITVLASAAILGSALIGPAFSQGAPQTVTLMKVDPQTLATGYRASKLVGSTVVNEANETVGTIDDLIITPGGQAPYAVLSVGGFLGLGTKYVVVPFPSLQVIDKRMVLRGATKEAVKALPDFKYNS